MKEEKEAERLFKEEQEAKFRENANKQRRKIAKMKANQEDLFAPIEKEPEVEQAAEEQRPESKPEKLTADALSKIDTNSKKSAVAKSVASKKSSKRPAWAVTEKQQEEEKE